MDTIRSTSRWLIVLAMLGGFVGTAHAVPTASFELGSFADFDKGKPVGTLLSSWGEVRLGYEVQRLKSPSVPLIWSTARGPGGVVYFGTGDEARLLVVRDGKVRELAKLDGLVITSLATSPSGKLWAAVMPGARVAEVNPKSGAWRVVATLPAKHIWALHYDGQRQRLFAASGAPGKLFEIALGGGKPRMLFDPKNAHLLCLSQDVKGNLLAGGGGPAILYRVDLAGHGMAVHDFGETEVHGVATGSDGAVFVAVDSFPQSGGGFPRFDQPPKTPGASGAAAAKAKKGKAPKYRPNELRPTAKGAKGALYRVDPTGRVDELLALPSGYFTQLAVDRDGVLWAGEGSEGKVYLVQPDRTVLTAVDIEERQVLALSVAGAERYLATGDGGAIYRVRSRPSKEPSYESKALDAGFVSTWGKLHYRANGGGLRFSSRSGNTAKPDVTWSAWSAAASSGDDSAAIKSPAARYVQLRVHWSAPYKAVLRSLQAYFRPQNQRARVEAIAFPESKPSPTPQKHSTVRKIRWKVDNPDKDVLVYYLWYREELGAVWRALNEGKPVLKPEYDWETDGIADDTYRIKVEASDERANGPETTLKHSLVSSPLPVDNRGPEIVGLKVAYPWVSGAARDALGPVSRIEVAIDGGSWTLVDARDGVYDSATEGFRLRLPAALTAGVHVVAVRATDEAGNMGAVQRRFKR